MLKMSLQTRLFRDLCPEIHDPLDPCADRRRGTALYSITRLADALIFRWKRFSSVTTQQRKCMRWERHDPRLADWGSEWTYHWGHGCSCMIWKPQRRTSLALVLCPLLPYRFCFAFVEMWCPTSNAPSDTHCHLVNGCEWITYHQRSNSVNISE